MSGAPIYTQFTPAHRILFEDHFRPTLPEREEVRPEAFELAGDGEFQSPEWHFCVARKFEVLIRGAQECSGRMLVWCDADVQFFPGFSTREMVAALQHSQKDVLFQQEGTQPRPGHKEANTGVFVAHVNEQMMAFFERVLALMRAADRPNDQNLINELLPAQDQISWGYLSPRYYARTHGFPPARDILLHHANTTTRNSVAGKCAQMRLVRRAVLGSTRARLGACAEVFLQKGVPALARSLRRSLQRATSENTAQS